MLKLLSDGGLFVPGVLDGHVAGLERIRALYQVTVDQPVAPPHIIITGDW